LGDRSRAQHYFLPNPKYAAIPAFIAILSEKAVKLRATQQARRSGEQTEMALACIQRATFPFLQARDAKTKASAHHATQDINFG
jgi:hypothetical protein